jgi:hypothetical protein
MRRFLASLIFVLVFVMVSCNSDNAKQVAEKPVGSEGAPCYGNKTCDDGLTCVSDLCVDLNELSDNDSGNTGNSGDSGNTGNTGNTGNSGDTGDSGNTGNSGNSGDTGNTASDDDANTGDTGDSGNSGNTGDSGNSGDTAPDDDSDEMESDEDSDNGVDYKIFFSEKKQAFGGDLTTQKQRWEYCQNLEERGYDDWRIPSVKEGQLLIKNCSSMNPFEFECYEEDNKIKGCTKCQSIETSFSLFDNDTQFFLTDSVFDNVKIIAIEPQYGNVIISDIGSFQWIRCIRGDPFATEPER